MVALSAALPGAALAHATEPAPAPVAATVPAKAPAGTPTAGPADPPPSDIPAPDPAAQTPSPRIDPLPGTPDAAEERPPTYSVALIQGFSGANGNRTPGGRETSAVLTYAEGSLGALYILLTGALTVTAALLRRYRTALFLLLLLILFVCVRAGLDTFFNDVAVQSM